MSLRNVSLRDTDTFSGHFDRDADFVADVPPDGLPQRLDSPLS